MSKSFPTRKAAVVLTALAAVATTAGAGVAAADAVPAAAPAPTFTPVLPVLPVPTALPVPRVQEGTVGIGFPLRLVYKARKGFRNVVYLRTTGDGLVYLRDELNTIIIGSSASNRCVQVDEHSVRCSSFDKMAIELGDGNDFFMKQEFQGSSSVTVYGGPGDDELLAASTSGPTRFDGGPGRDICAATVGGRVDERAECEILEPQPSPAPRP